MASGRVVVSFVGGQGDPGGIASIARSRVPAIDIGRGKRRGHEAGNQKKSSHKVVMVFC